MRKFLRPKFWSLGTHLGSLGPGSRADLGLGPCRLQFLVIWGPYECPALTACQGTAENPKLIGAWCGYGVARGSFLFWLVEKQAGISVIQECSDGR